MLSKLPHKRNWQQLIQDKREQIIEIANKYGAKNIRIFGSVARGDDTEESDIDFLMDIESGRSLFNRISLIQELEELLDCKVDLAKPHQLHQSIREQILKECIDL